MPTELVGILKTLSEFGALGVSVGLNLYIFVLWLRGGLFTKANRDDWNTMQAMEIERREAIYKRENEFREALRLETIADRRESDQRIEKLTVTIAEQNELVRRSLDFNERLVEDAIRERPARSGRGRA